MKRLTAAFLFVCFIAMSASVSYAQEMKAKKMEGHTWHQVVLVKYKPGTFPDAKKIIKNHFAKAGMESGAPGPQMLEFKTGEWDAMFIWSMDSISDMDWEIHPNDEKWWAAMVKQEGSEEKAMQVWKGYLDLVESSTSYLATSQSIMGEDSMGSQ